MTIDMPAGSAGRASSRRPRSSATWRRRSRRWSGCRARSSPMRSATSACRRAQRKMRVQQLWHWIYVRGVTRFDAMTSVSKELRAALDAAFHARPARGRRRAGLGRRHAQMAAAAARRARRRAAARGRVRLHPGHRARHAVRLEPGRLHAHLLVLPHRHAAAGAQSHRRRDRRPGDGRARPARRLAGRRRRPTARSCRRRRAASSPTS